jgi:hypothetical protein
VPRVLSSPLSGPEPVRWRTALLAGCAALGALHTLAAVRGHALNLDGVSYLDLADRIAADPRAFANGYWSPLYPALLAIPAALARPTGSAQLVWAHAVNLAVYFGCLAAFAILWHEATRLAAGPRIGGRPEARGRARDLARVVWDAFGALLFVWATLGLINLWAITPDLLVAALAFAAFALLLRIRRGGGGRAGFLLLGLVLGLGYWAKAALFPLAPLFLASAYLVAPRVGRRAGSALAAGAFALVALPLVAAQSTQKGRLTFGDAGSLNAAWFVGRQPQLLWRGEGAEHPPRLLLAEPPVYAYGGGPGGTYPPWFDPSYWQEGTRVALRPADTARALAANAWHAWQRVVQPILPVLATLLVVGALAPQRSRRRGDAPARGGAPPPSGAVETAAPRGGEPGRAEPEARRAEPPTWPLWLPAIAGAAIYLPVYLESRYVAPFAVVMVTHAGASARTPRTLGQTGGARSGRPLAIALSVALLAPLGLEVGAQHVREGFPLIAGTAIEQGRRTRPPRGFEPPAPVLQDPVRVSRALAAAGLAEGARIAIIGHALDESRWARLAGVSIVAEVSPSGIEDLRTSPRARRRVLARLREAGVDAVVAPGTLPATPELLAEGWRVGGARGYLILVGAPSGPGGP